MNWRIFEIQIKTANLFLRAPNNGMALLIVERFSFLLPKDIFH